MDKHYCIMDMDGTLINSMIYWNHLGSDYLHSKGIKGDLSWLMEEVKTMTLLDSCICFKKYFDLPESAEEIMVSLKKIMEGHYAHDIELKPGVEEYLDILRARGTRLCIATATAMPLVKLCLDRLGIRPYFDFLVSCEEVGAGKEEPLVFEEAMRRFDAGITPSGCAVFEDSLTAVRTAGRAGFYTVGVYDPSNHEWDKLKAAADETIIDWKEAAAQL